MGGRKSVITLQSVADRADVSLKTASNAINGTGRMSEQTRERVLAIVDELDYKVNVAARNLTRGRTDTITLAVPTLRSAYLAELAEGITDRARTHGLQTFVTTFESADGSSQSLAKLEQFNQHASDGMILSMAEQEDLTPADLDVDFPLVCLGARSTFGVADRITTDDIADARAATAYLFDRGSRNIAVVGAHEPYDRDRIAAAVEGNAGLRLRGITEECEARGRPLDPRLVGVTGFRWPFGAGYREAQALIEQGIPFDGLICLNDAVAISAMSALREANLRIPDDVQVIGFDNIDESEYAAPPLTTMDSRFDWVVPTAVDTLVARIAGTRTHVETRHARSRIIARKTTR